MAVCVNCAYIAESNIFIFRCLFGSTKEGNLLEVMGLIPGDAHSISLFLYRNNRYRLALLSNVDTLLNPIGNSVSLRPIRIFCGDACPVLVASLYAIGDGAMVVFFCFSNGFCKLSSFRALVQIFAIAADVVLHFPPIGEVRTGDGIPGNLNVISLAANLDPCNNGKRTKCTCLIFPSTT